MAKKRFTDGLSDLFDNPFDATVPNQATEQEQSVIGEDEVQMEVDIPVPSDKARKKLSSKGFTGSLDSFLSDSFEQEGVTTGSPSNSPRRRNRKTGLDFLIRSTVQADDEDRNPRGKQQKDTKRVTLIFRKDHLSELKSLAKDRNIYLKDLVGEMVSAYLDK